MKHKNIKIHSQIAVLMLAGFILSACGSSSQQNGRQTPSPTSTPDPNPIISCIPEIPHHLSVMEASKGSLDDTRSSLSLKDEVSVTLKIALMDECNEVVGNSNSFTASLSASQYGSIASTSMNTITLNLNQGSTLSESPLVLSFTEGALSGELNLHLKHTITSFPGLYRWYQSDSLNTLAHGTSVGSATQKWADHGGTESPFWGVVTQSGREPKLDLTSFPFPTLQFCGLSAGCSGVTLNSHLRIGSSYTEYVNQDLTLIFVVARANGNTNHILSNQSNGNNNGLFFGFTSNTNARFSLQGPNGALQINATVPAYSGTPTFEIWTLRLSTQASDANPGMMMRRNGELATQNPSQMSFMPSNTLIPLLGTQRSDNNSAKFFIANVATYRSALSINSICEIESMLNAKYSLGLPITCP